MSFEFRMPSLGPDMAAGTLVEWRIAPGQAIKRGDVIVLVETEKGIVDVEAFHDGVVERLLVEPGAHVPVGEVLAVLKGEASSPAAAAPSRPAVSSASGLDAPFDEALQETFPARHATAVHPADLPPKTRPRAPVTTPSASAAAPSPPRVMISPAARVRAQALNVSIDRLIGSGADGAIILEDVEKFARTRRTAPAEAKAAMRHAIGAAMTRAKREIPHYYLAHTFDFEPVRAWLENYNASRSIEDRLLYSPLLVKAVARTAIEIPGFNGYYRAQGFQPATEVHVGFAIAQRGGGLVAPAILGAATKDPATIMRELKDLVIRARTEHLRSSELASPTITITSLGDEGVDAVWPIIFPDQVAILGAGRITDQPWAVAGRLLVRPVLTLTLAADHRVSDGRAGARFLSRIVALLSAPDEL